MSIFRFSLILLLAAPALSGCNKYDSTLPVPGVAAAPMPQIDDSVANSTPVAARRGMSDKTWLWTRGGGPAQIHYSTADGRDFTWLVGERRILAGQWRIDTSAGADGQQLTQICLRYPGIRRPDLSDSWLCRPAGTMFTEMQERESGDPLRFAGRTQAQFVLTQTPASLAEVEGRVVAGR